MKLKKRVLAATLCTILSFSLSTNVFSEELPIASQEISASSNTIQIEVDDNVLEMADAAPIMYEGNIYVPFSAFYKAIGAETNYEASTKTVTAIKNNVAASFSVYRKTATIKKNDVISTVTMETAPIIQNDFIYIPGEWAGKVFNYNVGYDNSTNTLIMVDIAKMMKPYEDQFKIMDKYMAYSRSYADKNYTVDGSFQINTVIGDEAAAPIKIDGTLTGVTSTAKTDMEINMNLDMLDAMKSLTGVDPATEPEVREILNLLKNIKIEIYVNLETGKYYFRSPLVTSQLHLNENVWIEMDFNEILESAGYDSSFLTQMIQLSQKSSFTEAYTDILTMMPISSKEDITALKQMIEMTVKMYGDAAFTKTGNQYVSHYQQTSYGAKTATKLALTVNDANKVIGYNLEMTVSDGNIDVTKMTISQDKDDKSKMNMKFNMPGYLSMDFQMDMQMKETKGKAFGSPSSNNMIISFEEALSM